MNSLLVISALALAQPAPAEHHNHSMKLGSVAFPTSCSPAANALFSRGLAWLHSFEYEQAESTFMEASAADPACAMAYWGRAMSLYHPLWAPPSPVELQKGRAAVAKAEAAPAKSQRERDYVGAIATFYRGSEKLDHKTRSLAYNLAMKELQSRYPDDHEAAIFYALSQAAAGTLDNDPNFSREKDAAAILNAVLKAKPDHPGVTHYLIHSFDYPPLADLAVAAARQYASIAPDSPHAQHMPSHIFTRLGMWDDSIASNLKSAAAARDMLRRKGFSGASREELHAMDYLVYAYLQTGRDKEARRIQDQLNAMQQVDEPIFSVAYAATAIPARLALERRQWREAAELELPKNVRMLAPLEKFQWATAHIHFARAVGAARSGDPSAAQGEVAKLRVIEDALIIPAGSYDWKAQVGIERQVAAAWLERATGKNDDAVRLMRTAADSEDALEKHPVTPGAILPAREQLGDLLLDIGKPAEALVAYETSLKRAPGRLAGILGAARAAKLSADPVKTRYYYAQLAELTKNSDGNRAEIEEARSIAAKL